MTPQDLTTEQKIERLAEFMGWNVYPVNTEPPPQPNCCYLNTGSSETMAVWLKGDSKPMMWNPLKDENHFRMLLEKVMEDGLLFLKFIDYFKRSIVIYAAATLQERCDALISVLPEGDE